MESKLDKLKGLLDAGKITQEVYDLLTGEFNTIIGQRDSARSEAAERRIKLKEASEKLTSLKGVLHLVGDKVGVDIDEDEGIEELKGKLESFDPKKVDDTKVQELEARLKRLTKEKEETITKLKTEAEQKARILKQKELASALAKQKVFDPDVISYKLEANVEFDESGKAKFRTEDGILVDLDEGVKEIVEKHPNWKIGQGQPGSGFKTGTITETLKTSNDADDILKAAGVKL